MLRTTAGVITGAVIGYLYQRFIGCRTGSCPITSNPFASTLYGALLGWLVARM